MEKFYLRVYYGNNYQDIDVIAYEYENTDGQLIFMNTDGDITCSYPSNMTAIMQIEEINDPFE
jgi:hypothetical protein